MFLRFSENISIKNLVYQLNHVGTKNKLSNKFYEIKNTFCRVLTEILGRFEEFKY